MFLLLAPYLILTVAEALEACPLGHHRLRAVELNLPSLPQFHNHLVYNIEVAHQVETCVLVVQALVRARGVEDVQRTLATHVEPLLQPTLRAAASMHDDVNMF